MIYTYGYIPTYENLIAEKRQNGGQAFKIGRREEYDYGDRIGVYEGGAIWQTADEAARYVTDLFITKPDLTTSREDWGVYAIDGTWDDVYYIKGEPFHRLMVDRPIVGLVK